MPHNGRPTVPEVVPLTRAVYRRSSVGCCLHIVLDDGNLEDAHVASCLERAREKGHEECIAAAEALMQMTRTQRGKVQHRTHWPRA